MIIGNTDRYGNSDNMLFMEEGNIIFIDHGAAFSGHDFEQMALLFKRNALSGRIFPAEVLDHFPDMVFLDGYGRRATAK